MRRRSGRRPRGGDEVLEESDQPPRVATSAAEALWGSATGKLGEQKLVESLMCFSEPLHRVHRPGDIGEHDVVAEGRAAGQHRCVGDPGDLLDRT